MSIPRRTCSVSDCKKPVFSKGYCADHARAFNLSAGGGGPNILTIDRQQPGLDDMVMLPKVVASEILENLRIRHKNDIIYTYIGHVIVSVNPFKNIGIYGTDYIKSYSGKYPHELPPHIFSLAESAYKTMVGEEEDQCVIISGESGAGKTEASKQIMTYIAAVSGKGEGAEKVKDMILESNPLLEAFGNAKTLRNNNSSRFGKYFEIKFSSLGTPGGGFITNFLLEKSRVVYEQKGERTFHIFYQLCKGAPSAAKKQLSLSSCNDFHYLRQGSTFDVDGVNDEEEFAATRAAMKTVGMSGKEQEAVFQLVAAVMHIGNIEFKELKNGGVSVARMEIAASLLGVDQNTLVSALSTRHIKTAREEYDVPNNAVQAITTRDALSKALYSRLFDWLVRRVNSAIATDGDLPLCMGVLDIYGFEVFENNGFEQFCINFVNEKLQQIFIELTLKSEQEEYVREGIAWKPISFFNNKIVCELIEGKRPPGIFSVLDDVCATMHAQSEGSDRALSDKLSGAFAGHAHFASGGKGFLIKHYAGDVNYNAADFADKNKDTLYNSLIFLMQSSSRVLIPKLFPDEVDLDSKKRPPTAGFKIKSQAAALVETLMKCNPHYVRCIKSNDLKKPNVLDTSRVDHQIKYLGLLENIKVRRAGFAYRQEFHKFVTRFKLLSSKTWPNDFEGSDKDACKAILSAVSKSGLVPALTGPSAKEEAQIGRSKIFIKQPETVFALDAAKENKINSLVARVQRCWRRYNDNKMLLKLRRAATQYLTNKKERRKDSFYRPFKGQYLELDFKGIHSQVFDILTSFDDRSKIHFSDRVQKINPSSITPENTWASEPILLIFTDLAAYFIQDHGSNNGPGTNDVSRSRSKTTVSSNSNSNSSALLPPKRFMLRRRIPLSSLSSLSLSAYADNYLFIHVTEEEKKTAPEWMKDNLVKECCKCHDSFGLFNRRHHCRLCAKIFCQNCSSRTQIIPDYNFLTPVRVCDDCFGLESSDLLADHVLFTSKKTEIVAIVQEIAKKFKKKFDVNFTDKVVFQTRDSPTSVKMKEMSFTRKKDAKKEQLNVVSELKAAVVVPPGLDQNFVIERQKAAEKRRKEYERKRVEENRRRTEKEKQREIERERERKERIEEKKRRKAEAQREKEEQEAAAAAARRPTSLNRPSSTSSASLQASKSNQPNQANPIPQCSTCGCNDFVKNAFKKNKCNSCFHEH